MIFFVIKLSEKKIVKSSRVCSLVVSRAICCDSDANNDDLIAQFKCMRVQNIRNGSSQNIQMRDKK